MSNESCFHEGFSFEEIPGFLENEASNGVALIRFARLRRDSKGNTGIGRRVESGLGCRSDGKRRGSFPDGIPWSVRKGQENGSGEITRGHVLGEIDS